MVTFKRVGRADRRELTKGGLVEQMVGITGGSFLFTRRGRDSNQVQNTNGKKSLVDEEGRRKSRRIDFGNLLNFAVDGGESPSKKCGKG